MIITIGLAAAWLLMAHLDTGHQPQALAWELCTGSQKPTCYLSVLHTAASVLQNIHKKPS